MAKSIFFTNRIFDDKVYFCILFLNLNLNYLYSLSTREKVYNRKFA